MDMDGEVKSNKFLISQPASVHSYSKLSKSESPRTHTSPTSILRKFPQSLRHDQKHQTKIKRNSSPVAMVIFGEAVKNGKKLDRDVKSWCLGDSNGTDTESTESVTFSATVECSFPSEEHFCDYSAARSLMGSETITPNDGNPIRSYRESPSGNINCNSKKSKSVHKSNNVIENASVSKKDVVLSFSQAEGGNISRELPEQQPSDKLKIGSLKKLSVINNSLNEFKNFNDKFWCNSADKISDFDNKILSPVHKSTPNLLRSEPFSVSGSVSQPECISDRLGRIEYFDGKKTLADDLNQNTARHFRNHQVPLKGSDSLPQLNYKYRIIHSILPKMNRASCGSHENLGGTRRNTSKGCVRADPRMNSNLLFNGVGRNDSYRLLGNPNPDEFGDLYSVRTKPIRLNCKNDVIRLEDESERISLINGQPTIVVQPRNTEKEFEKCTSVKETMEVMPALKSLVEQKHDTGYSGKHNDSGTRVPPPSISCSMTMTDATGSGSCSTLNSPVVRDQDNDDEGLVFKKCDTIYALTDLFRTDSSLQIEPMKAINRLRVPPNPFGSSASRMCSRCSSLLSMASSSRYSLNTTGSGFIPCSPSEKEMEPIMLCKLCLLEVPLSQSIDINHCGCTFCRDCMRLYVEFEIQEGAYDISCPDAQCRKQGIISIDEVEILVTTQMMERYLRFRLNHEVDLDRNRTWCPRAGCETVCNICPREKCSPTSVHCPTCDSDFCSNCKNPWHWGLTCEENSRKLAKEGRSDFMEAGIPFDSELIKSCPMCNVPIEKDEGCAQMMCKRCKHVFCWYCLASLDDDFLLRHYDKGPCKNKLGHSRASVIWHRTQVIGIFAGFGILLLVASPLLLVAAPCIVCCKCRVCSGTKMDPDEDLPEESGT